MPDKQKDTEKTEVPDHVVSEQDKQKQEAADARGKHLKALADNKDLAVKYGEPDFASLLNKVGSDSVFARQLVQDLVTKDDTITVGISPDSPQEHNITGNIDHTVDTPTKIKREGQSTAPATAEAVAPLSPVNTGVTTV